MANAQTQDARKHTRRTRPGDEIYAVVFVVNTGQRDVVKPDGRRRRRYVAELRLEEKCEEVTPCSLIAASNRGRRKETASVCALDDWLKQAEEGDAGDLLSMGAAS